MDRLFSVRAWDKDNGPNLVLSKAMEACFQAGPWCDDGWQATSAITRGTHGLRAIINAFEFFIKVPEIEKDIELFKERVDRVIELVTEV